MESIPLEFYFQLDLDFGEAVKKSVLFDKHFCASFLDYIKNVLFRRKSMPICIATGIIFLRQSLKDLKYQE